MWVLCHSQFDRLNHKHSVWQTYRVRTKLGGLILLVLPLSSMLLSGCATLLEPAEPASIAESVCLNESQIHAQIEAANYDAANSQIIPLETSASNLDQYQIYAQTQYQHWLDKTESLLREGLEGVWMRPLDWQDARIEVELNLLSDGNVNDVVVLRSNRSKRFDDSVVASLNVAAPFKIDHAYMRECGFNSLVLRLIFRPA